MKYKKGQEANITGVIYDIGDRVFNTHNKGNMAWKLIEMDNEFIR